VSNDGKLPGKGSTRKAEEAIMAMRDDMSDEEHLGDIFNGNDRPWMDKKVDRLAPVAPLPVLRMQRNLCPGTGSKHAKIVMHHEPEGHV
jgi:hypothetical protein